jgi:hypothetical protein
MLNPYETQPLRVVQLDPHQRLITRELYFGNAKPKPTETTILPKSFVRASNFRTDKTSITVYPEDNFLTVKQKIQTATGIPIFRQHIFFSTKQGGTDHIASTYSMSLRNWPVDINAATMLATCFNAGVELDKCVHGLPIDMTLVDGREQIKITARDTFIKLEILPGSFVYQIFLIDLADMLQQLWKHNTAAKIAQDTFIIETIYWGFVAKFFPMITPDLLKSLIIEGADDDEVGTEYPDMVASKRSLELRFAVEQRIINKVYTHSSQIHKLKEAGKQIHISIVHANVQVKSANPLGTLNLRNIFDWFATSEQVPVITLSFDSVEKPANRINAIKRHLSSHHPKTERTLEPFLEAELEPFEHVSIAILVSKQSKVADMQYFQLVTLMLSINGSYTISSHWEEDEHIAFDDMVTYLNEFVSPIIKKINSFGIAAFSVSTELLLPDTTFVYTRIKSVNAAIFWSNYLSSENFKELKMRLNDFERAGILKVKLSHAANIVSILFIKGMTNFDIEAFERLYLKLRKYQNLSNQYLHMTDPTIKQYWDHIFGGRTIHIIHRSTDIKIEVSGVNLVEFDLIFYYMIYFLETILTNRPKRAEVDVRKTDRVSRQLIERDPNLFDFHKYDENLPGYTSHCQGQRQPLMFSQAEFDKMDDKTKEKMTRFWNFTRKEPAFYQCIHKKYPYVGFQVKAHPLNYCVPCCNVAKPTPGSKKERVKRVCTTKFVYDETESKAAKTNESVEDNAVGSENPAVDPTAIIPIVDGKQELSGTIVGTEIIRRNRTNKTSNKVVVGDRYTLLFGKTISVGRSSFIPPVLEGFLFPPPLTTRVYRLMGVEQSIPLVKNAGFMFSISQIVRLTVPQLIDQLEKSLSHISSYAHLLGRGLLNCFANISDFMQALRQTFVHPEPLVFTPFMIGGPLGNSWTDLIADVVGTVLQLHIIRFRELANGEFILVSPRLVCDYITHASFTMGIIFETQHGTYPLVIADKKMFHITGAGDTFESVFNCRASYGRDVLNAMAKIVSGQCLCRPPFVAHQIRFLLQSRSSGTSLFGVRAKFIDNQYRCFGLLIEQKFGDKAEFYVPLANQTIFADFIPGRIGGIRRGLLAKPETLMLLVWILNDVRKHYGEAQRLIVPLAYLRWKDVIIGFIAPDSDDCIQELYYYHQDIPIVNEKAELYVFDDAFVHGVNKIYQTKTVALSDVTIVRIPYHPCDVSEKVFEYSEKTSEKSKILLPANKQHLAVEGLYSHYQFRLLCAEFALQIRNRKNETIRTQIASIIATIAFTNINDRRLQIHQILAKYPKDIQILDSLLGVFYTTSKFGCEALQAQVLGLIGKIHFDFDCEILFQLHLETDPKIVRQQVNDILQPHVTFDKTVNEFIGNVYVPCSVDPELREVAGKMGFDKHCQGGKLRLSSSKYESLLDLLVADIANPIKVYSMLAMVSGVIHELQFVSRANEHIEIEIE